MAKYNMNGPPVVRTIGDHPIRRTSVFTQEARSFIQSGIFASAKRQQHDHLSQAAGEILARGGIAGKVSSWCVLTDSP
jgi:hypothetical protein